MTVIMRSARALLDAQTAEMQTALLVLLLKGLQWGAKHLVSEDVFFAICGAFTVTGLELMVLRLAPKDSTHTSKYEVLLIPRPDTDPYFGGLYHVPGSVRRGHESDDSILSRVCREEIPGAATSVISYVRDNTFRTKRGQERTMLHVTQLFGEYSGPGEWFPMDELPRNTLEHHRVLVAQARTYWFAHGEGRLGG